MPLRDELMAIDVDDMVNAAASVVERLRNPDDVEALRVAASRDYEALALIGPALRAINASAGLTFPEGIDRLEVGWNLGLLVLKELAERQLFDPSELPDNSEH